MEYKNFSSRKNTILIWFLFFLVIGVFISVLFLSFSEKKEFEISETSSLESSDPSLVSASNLKIQTSQINFVIGDFDEVKVLFDRDGEGPNVAVDVTIDAVLYSNDPSIAEISNIIETKGQLMLHKEGKTSIVALYEDMSSEIEISVENPKLSVYCKAYPENVRKGEAVEWIVFFSEKGVPNYSYTWKGTDGFVGDLGMVAMTYETSGRKEASVEIVDMVGNKANAECTPLEVSD